MLKEQIKSAREFMNKKAKEVEVQKEAEVQKAQTTKYNQESRRYTRWNSQSSE